MVVFQALTWEARDDEEEHLISIFGKTQDGKSVCVTTSFNPYFYIKLPKNANEQSVRILYDTINKERPGRILTYQLVKLKDVWGFQNNEKSGFMKLIFKDLKSRNQISGLLRRPLESISSFPQKLYEANIDPVLRLMHRTGIQSTGWMDSGDACVRSHLASVDMDLFCNNWENLKPVNRNDIAPFVVASFDIESYSSTGKFPDPEVPGDACFQIAISLTRFGEETPYDKTCLCYKETDTHLEGSNIVSFKTEKQLLEAFTKYLHEKDVDILTGWNIFGFDLEYIFKRAHYCGCHPDFYYLGKLKNHECEMMYKKLSSSALGDNTLKLLPMPGRFIFDLFHEVKRGYKLDSYKLNAVALKYIGEQKIDMPPKEMFARFREEDPVKLRDVAEYCIQDTLLPHKLLKKLCILMNLMEMAKATWVPLCFLAERGQQIKVFSQLSKKARELGFIIPTIYKKNTDAEGYEGATVLEAQKGAYYGPITALDFEGLYPSIMMAHNLCYSTLVMDVKYSAVPGVTYEEFEIGGKTFRFAQEVESLLPSILLELKQFRKQAKKEMSAATGYMKDIFNGKQLAYKVSMNSVYGFTGANNGMLPCVAIASTVTCKGRSMIDETKTYVEANFPGAKVRYGDSVMPGTPVLVRCDDFVSFKKIENLGDEWYNYTGFMKKGKDKEQSEVYGVEAWTHLGWKPIRRVIRHKCQKKIWRVVTDSGLVDVTEDHSLLDDRLRLVKPEQLEEGECLFHSFPDAPYVPKFHHGGNVKVKSQLQAQWYYYYYFTRGYNVEVDTEGDMIVIHYKKSQKDPQGAVKSCKVLHESWDGYVYDIETDAGTFQAGVGQLVVKNTDSVMVEFDVEGRTGEEAIAYSWTQGERAAAECSKLFKKPNNLELEKVYCPYFLYSKKRYAAKLWTKGKDGRMKMDYIDVKGLQLVRRDNTPHVREVCSQLLDVVLSSNDPEPAKALALEKAIELLDGRVPHEKLVLSQQLGDNYKSTNLAHLMVRNKMRERQPGSEPQSGDRVPYLLTDTGDPRAKAFEKSEDPNYVLAHNIPVDYKYYFENKFLNPVSDLLEPLVKNPKEEIFGSLLAQKVKRGKRVFVPDKNQPSVFDIFKKFEKTHPIT